jgi:hypothetical protein
MQGCSDHKQLIHSIEDKLHWATHLIEMWMFRSGNHYLFEARHKKETFLFFFFGATAQNLGLGLPQYTLSFTSAFLDL